MQTATLIEGRDTVITVGGSERPFRSSVGSVVVAADADWYVNGMPLTVTVGSERIDFLAYGPSRLIDASDLTLLGTVNGMPVYANRSEVQDVIGQLEDLNSAQPGIDLGKLLKEHQGLSNGLEDVSILYVPVHETGCIFQAVQRQEEVVKANEAPCPEIGPDATNEFRNVPLRVRLRSAPRIAKRRVQDILSQASYGYSQLEAGALMSGWSAEYRHPDRRLFKRRHAFLFGFSTDGEGVEEMTTEVIVRWLVCSNGRFEERWSISDSDAAARPTDLIRILDALRSGEK